MSLFYVFGGCFSNCIVDNQVVKYMYTHFYIFCVFSQRDNFTSSQQGSRHVTISYLDYPASVGSHLSHLPCGVLETESSAKQKASLCTQFAVSKDFKV